MSRVTSSLLLASLLLLPPHEALAGVTADLAAGKIPLYPGAKPHPAASRARGTEAFATMRATLSEVVAFYRRELPKRGWQETVADDLLNQDLDKVPLALMLYEQGAQQLRIVVTTAKGQKTTVWIAREEASHGKSAR